MPPVVDKIRESQYIQIVLDLTTRPRDARRILGFVRDLDRTACHADRPYFGAVAGSRLVTHR